MALSKKAMHRVGEVFSEANLGDTRRVRRAISLAQALAEAPTKTLPQIWSSEAELEAGYRFLRNPKTDFEALMVPVQAATQRRAKEAGRVLVLHDTTDITCPAAEADEVGHLSTGNAGFYVHHAICVSDDEHKTPLGVLWSKAWGREQRSRGINKMRSSDIAALAERESDRWLEGVTEAHLWMQPCKHAIHVMDSEADSFRLLSRLSQLEAEFVVRMRFDRRVVDGKIADTLAAQPIRLRRRVRLSTRKKSWHPVSPYQQRDARDADLSIRCATVELQPPKASVDAFTALRVNIVQVLEENPPEGAQPVSWILATSLPIKTKKALEHVIDTYKARWIIEEFHKALKTGCMFEKRLLESFDALTTLLAMCYPISCELLRIRTRARQSGIPASQILRKTLLDCLRAHPKAKPLNDNPTAEQAMRVIAGLGGHIKHNGPPGWQSLAVGYMELLTFERGWLAAKSQICDQ